MVLDPIQIRFFLFIVGCFGSRLAFTIISYLASGWFLKLLGIIALFPALGFFYFIFIGKRDTGIEVLGDKIWWKNLRPIHLILWLFFAYLAITGNSKAWIVLLIDTFFGLSAFLIYHSYHNNFKKLKQ
jgi:hypothetical protein